MIIHFPVSCQIYFLGTHKIIQDDPLPKFLSLVTTFLREAEGLQRRKGAEMKKFYNYFN